MKEEKFIDLGLPSGTIWSDRNVGAETIMDNGKYFSFSEAQKQGNVPNKDQFQELIDECEWTWKDKGYEVTGPNGNSIYLPAAGFCRGINIYNVGSYGNYWTSSMSNDCTCCLYFDSDSASMDYCSRYYGQSVRLVK